ncbi:type II secretion system secretin GspD [Imbroritus primus]|uniref:type II secretion system secretin GspD n=1 Tax=Imbroritus primus TaxID=3058603 RepID=UPI003D161715
MTPNRTMTLPTRCLALACSLALALPPAAMAQNRASTSVGDSPTARSNQVSLNFVNAELDTVVRAVGQATGRNFVIDPRVKGTVNLVTEQPVSQAQALETLGSVLRMQGYAMVDSNGFTKVVPEADAKLQGAPTTVGGKALRGDQVVTQIFTLNYESATNLVPVLRPMIAPNNTVTAYPGNNTLVITDYADNLRRIARVIAAIDNPGGGGGVDTVSLEHALAVDAAALVQKIFDPGASGVNDPSLKVSAVADARSNSVVLRGASGARLQQAKALLAKLDRPGAERGNIHVVPLKNANAVALAQTLRAVIAADASFRGEGGQGGAPAAPAPMQAGAGAVATPVSTAAMPAGNTGSGLGGGAIAASFAADTRPTTGGIVQADTATNSLIITASDPVYRNLRGVIEQLDARRAQVYVESMIVEISSTRASELGIQWQGISGRLFGGTNFTSGGSNILNLSGAANALTNRNGSNISSAAAGMIPDIPGLNIGVLDRALGLGALLRAFANDDSVNILSTPNLITLDNEEAKILIGQNIPVTTGSYAQTGSSATVTPFNTFDRKDVGITLRVRPQISEGGTVKLQIYQESSSVVPGTLNAQQGPTTNVRSIETNVLVDDGQVVVLGGLLEDTYGNGLEKVPGLGDIPVLGALFRYEAKTRQKTNLLVFLRPYVLRTAAATDSVTLDRYDYMRSGQQSYESPNWIMRDKDTPLLPPIDAPRNPLVDPRPQAGRLGTVPVRPGVEQTAAVGTAGRPGAVPEGNIVNGRAPTGPIDDEFLRNRKGMTQ